jgi:hypothetical protein
MTPHGVFAASFHGIDMCSGRVPAFIVVCSTLVAACGGSEPIEDDARNRLGNINMRSEVNAGRLEQRVDINLDGNPDLWEFYDVYDDEGSHIIDEGAIASHAGDDLRLVERRIDTNLDTMVDIVRFYDARQQLERELLDINFDGGLDYTNIYRSGILAERQTDADGNQVPEEVRFYRGGNLARIESDVDGDGRLEFYEYFRENELTHYGIDRDGDGTVDEWTRRQGGMARTSRSVVPAADIAPTNSLPAPVEGSSDVDSDDSSVMDLEGSGSQLPPASHNDAPPQDTNDAAPQDASTPPNPTNSTTAPSEESPATENADTEGSSAL